MTVKTPSLLFEKFQVISCLKKDQSSSVYIAHHRYLDKRILLKTLDIDEQTDPVLLHRFQREAKILAQCDHPNIIKVLDFGTHESCFYISFEYFPSTSLREFIRHHELFEHAKISIFYQVAQALQTAHHKGIIHRDIKPENILVDESLLVKLADFGLAQLSDERLVTQKTTVVGTPGYMSPEQILGEKLTCQSDLFSLGIVIQELFTGKNPFMGSDVGKTLNNILTLPEDKYISDSSGMPSPVREIVASLMQRNKSKRMASADELIAQLQHHYPTFTKMEVPRPAGPQKAGRPVFVWVIVCMIMIGALGLGYQFFFKNNINRRPEEKSDIVPLPTPSATVEEPHARDVSPSSPAKHLKDAATEARTISPSSGKLFVKCLPWADVYVDSVRIDTTPMSKALQLTPGHHEIELRHPDYPSFRKKVEIYPDLTTEMAVNLDTVYAFLDPQVYPWGEIYVDNRMYGMTPFSKPLILNPGLHTIMVRNICHLGLLIAD